MKRPNRLASSDNHRPKWPNLLMNSFMLDEAVEDKARGEVSYPGDIPSRLVSFEDSQPGEAPPIYASEAGPFNRIYDPSAEGGSDWYIDDHSFVRDRDGGWHLFGTTHAEPASPMDERIFAHATGPSLRGPWKREAPALVAAPGESVLRTPYVVACDGLYFMFYCAGGESGLCPMMLATSKDLWTWTRRGVVFEDGEDARAPFVTRIGEAWVMYYTAMSDLAAGHSIVAYRTSYDILRWSERRVAFVDPSVGLLGRPSKSPRVVRRGNGYFLFLGSRGSSRRTDVFFSEDPFHFTIANRSGRIAARAAEVIEGDDGRMYVSHAGPGQGGVWLAPLRWSRPTCSSVETPCYKALLMTAPHTELLSLKVSTNLSGTALREVLKADACGTTPTLAVGSGGDSVRPGAAASVVQSADGTRLRLRGIPLGLKPVTMDLDFVFDERALDLAITWHVSETVPVREVAWGVETRFSDLGDESKLGRGECDVHGFPRWIMAGDARTSVVIAYKAGSAWNTDDRRYKPSDGTLSWRSIGSSGGVEWAPGTYAGGRWRVGASDAPRDAAFAEWLYARLSSSQRL